MGSVQTRCSSGPPLPQVVQVQQTQPQRPQRAVYTGTSPLYCAFEMSDGITFGSCFNNADKCTGNCAPYTALACFNYRDALSNDHHTRCSPTIGDCERRLSIVRANPDADVTVEQCDIYRTAAR